MNSFAAADAAAASLGYRPPFTASQWQELEHQALIFKYLVAGIPVPPELLLPIRKSLESMAARFYHPAMGYCSFYGKKIDPEPGRCRRTDGKKWRCSKDAYPDSKYCERHMHRGRNRSRKPVEMQILSQSQSSSSSSSSSSPSSTMASLAPSGSGVSAGSGTAAGGGSFPSGIPLHSLGGVGGSSATQVSVTDPNFNQLQMDRGSYGMGGRDYRYPREVRNEVDGHCFFLEASGSAKGMGFNSSLDSDSRLITPQVPSYSLSKSRNDSLLVENYALLQSMQGFGRVGVSSLPKQQQHFFESHFNSSDPMKNPLRPFFDEWPKTRSLWPDLEDERSKGTSFSTTQLSISLPMSSDFTTSSRSPSGVP